jgi:hypothetical protein
MNKKSYEVQILVNGKSVREYQKDNLVFIEGREGTHYEIRVKNNGWKRVKAIIYVDGNSVLSDNNDESGYIVNGYDSLVVKGFRTSDETEAEFIFSTKGESRAQTVKGYAKDCGAIGVKIVEEKQEEIVWEWAKPINSYYYGDYNSYEKPVEYDRSFNSNDTYSCNANLNMVEESKSPSSSVLRSNGFDLGTKMGDDVESKVTYTTFDSGDVAATFQIHYASRQGLMKMGINLKKEKQAHIPDAFGGFCRRPKNK